MQSHLTAEYIRDVAKDINERLLKTADRVGKFSIVEDRKKVYASIDDLFQVMRLLADISEDTE